VVSSDRPLLKYAMRSSAAIFRAHSYTYFGVLPLAEYHGGAAESSQSLENAPFVRDVFETDPSQGFRLEMLALGNVIEQ